MGYKPLGIAIQLVPAGDLHTSRVMSKPDWSFCTLGEEQEGSRGQSKGRDLSLAAKDLSLPRRVTRQVLNVAAHLPYLAQRALALEDQVRVEHRNVLSVEVPLWVLIWVPIRAIINILLSTFSSLFSLDLVASSLVCLSVLLACWAPEHAL